jgi:hypothetical protein
MSLKLTGLGGNAVNPKARKHLRDAAHEGKMPAMDEVTETPNAAQTGVPAHLPHTKPKSRKPVPWEVMRGSLGGSEDAV